MRAEVRWMVLVLLATSLAACSAPKSEPDIPFLIGAPLAYEAASYAIEGLDGTPMGTLGLQYTRGESIRFEMEWSGESISGRATGEISNQTLAAQSIQTADGITYPWGESLFLPHSHMSVFGSLEPRGLLPIGLQRWAQPADETTWLVERTVLCAENCGLQDDGPTTPDVHVRANGTRGAFLPDEFQVDAAWLGFIAKRNEASQPSSSALVLGPAVTPERAVDFPCGFSLCESEDWPAALSLQRGLAALDTSLEWSTWDTFGKTPVQLVAFVPKGRALVGGNDILWGMFFNSGDGTTNRFFLAQAPWLAGVDYGPAVVTQSSDHDSGLGNGVHYVWPPMPMYSMDELVPAWLEQAGFELEDIRTLSLVGWPQFFNPDPTAHYALILNVEDDTGTYLLRGSPADGTLRSVRPQ